MYESPSRSTSLPTFDVVGHLVLAVLVSCVVTVHSGLVHVSAIIKSGTILSAYTFVSVC